MLEFDIGVFAPAHFAACGIDLPTALARSVPKRQAEFFYGRCAARMALRACGAPDAQIGVGMSREPLWPSGYVGSITHAGSVALATVVPDSRVARIGIDCERIGTEVAASELRQFVVNDAECAVLCNGLQGMSMAALLTLAFSAKESFYKATFAEVGRFFDFSAARVTALDMASGRLTMTLTEDLSPRLRRDGRIDLHFTFPAPDLVLTCHAEPGRAPIT